MGNRVFGQAGSVLRAVALGAVAAFVALGAAFQDTPVAQKAGPRIRPFVRGYIAVQVAEARGGQATTVAGIPRRLRDVFVPRVRVHLLNLIDNSRSKAETTDLSGRFTIPAS